ncbi:hypothetical protein D9619_001247 [Psilocybe cf. subviscida]|uniref:DUF3328 domain containing protein n=1 Tax=Psilocybe cf. subviscida TaxID=2480587 RepID=A0A8H5BGI5_9AGAR|nr:hypothetical protein D9619_001247 [Psilocybe cf. subviscida]
MSLTQDRGNNREPLHIHRLYQTLCKQLDNWRNRPPKTHFLATISMLSYIWINRKGIRTRYDALPGLDVDGLQLPHSRERPVGRHPEHRWKIFALAQLVVILTAVTFLSASHHYNQASNTGYSLARSAIRHQTRVFHTGYAGDRTPYIGKPSSKVDALWNELFEGGMFKITKEEERMLANRTSPLPGDKNHYLASLSVVHHLHCLNNIRKSMWPEYYPHFDIHRNEHMFSHQMHCIDLLRQVHMCNPDLTPSFQIAAIVSCTILVHTFSSAVASPLVISNEKNLYISDLSPVDNIHETSASDTTSWVDRFFSNVMEGDNGSDDSEEEEEEEEEEEDADFITGFAI